ncbi:MAG: glucose 1-dehydrogenase [Acidimicrobiales bacterium]|jgi:NAD(P)-dependent dehydrogenase (short-subunit alcohol dehydrogenase family)
MVPAPGSDGPGPLDRFDLTGKVALVTGGSRGLGREMVTAFARSGADVVITSRKLDACQSLADEVERDTGRRTLAVACNVGNWNELDGLVDAAYGAFGHVDILVNNAGMSLLYETVTDVTEQMWDKVVGLNMKGVFRLTALVGTRMADTGGGSIIMVSSTGSIRPDRSILPYAAAKAGMNSLTEGFARTFGPTVRVNCIMAGPFMTDVTKSWDMPSFLAAAKARHALERGGEPHEVVGAALYFASDASSYTTGAILRVDGGIP